MSHATNVLGLGLATHSRDEAGASQRSALHERVSQLFARYRDALFRYVYGILGDAGQAEDTTQEVFLKLYRELRKGRELEVGPWLYRVAHNLAIDHVRQSTATAALDDSEWRSLGERKGDRNLDVHEKFVAIEQRQQLEAISQHLTGQERRCIDLRLEGLRYREIAEVLGVRISSVEKYLSRAVKKIVKELDA